MIWALVVTILAWSPSAKLIAAQEVYAYPTQQSCPSAGRLIESTVRADQPAAKVVFECASMQKPINS